MGQGGGELPVWMEGGQGLNLKGLACRLRWAGIILVMETENHGEAVLRATCKAREIQSPVVQVVSWRAYFRGAREGSGVGLSGGVFA